MTTKITVSTDHIQEGKYIRVTELQYPIGAMAAGGITPHQVETCLYAGGESRDFYIWENKFLNIVELDINPDLEM